MAQPLWACLRLPALAIDSTLRHMPPGARQQPLALIDGPTQQRRVVAANRAARRAGVHPGQALSVAQSLCADLATTVLDPRTLAHSRELLAAWAWQYSSQVVIETFQDALLLEVGASLGLFGPWSKLERTFRNELTTLGFSHRIVLALNPWAAHALSTRHDGLAITHSAALNAALAALPVACAGFGTRQTGRLERMGLRSLGQLFALPGDALARRFGVALPTQLDVLRHGARGGLPLWQPPPCFAAAIEFGRAVTSTHALLFPLKRLCTDLATFLAARDGGVQGFDLTLQHEDLPPSCLRIGLLAPERDAGRLFDLARQHLERAQLPADVLGLGLLADDLPPFVPERTDLFETRGEQHLPWPQLRERLRARLGEDAVRGIAAQADHRPEHAWREPTGADASTDPMPHLPRPTWLLARPIPLRGPPPRLLAGPERIESGWWDGGDTRRDYYMAETTQGQRAWVFCAVGERGPFHLHGWFA